MNRWITANGYTIEVIRGQDLNAEEWIKFLVATSFIRKEGNKYVIVGEEDDIETKEEKGSVYKNLFKVPKGTMMPWCFLKHNPEGRDESKFEWYKNYVNLENIIQIPQGEFNDNVQIEPAFPYGNNFELIKVSKQGTLQAFAIVATQTIAEAMKPIQVKKRAKVVELTDSEKVLARLAQRLKKENPEALKYKELIVWCRRPKSSYAARMALLSALDTLLKDAPGAWVHVGGGADLIGSKAASIYKALGFLPVLDIKEEDFDAIDLSFYSLSRLIRYVTVPTPIMTAQSDILRNNMSRLIQSMVQSSRAPERKDLTPPQPNYRALGLPEPEVQPLAQPLIPRVAPPRPAALPQAVPPPLPEDGRPAIAPEQPVLPPIIPPAPQLPREQQPARPAPVRLPLPQQREQEGKFAPDEVIPEELPHLSPLGDDLSPVVLPFALAEGRQPDGRFIPEELRPGALPQLSPLDEDLSPDQQPWMGELGDLGEEAKAPAPLVGDVPAPIPVPPPLEAAPAFIGPVAPAPRIIPGEDYYPLPRRREAHPDYPFLYMDGGVPFCGLQAGTIPRPTVRDAGDRVKRQGHRLKEWEPDNYPADQYPGRTLPKVCLQDPQFPQGICTPCGNRAKKVGGPVADPTESGRYVSRQKLLEMAHELGINRVAVFNDVRTEARVGVPTAAGTDPDTILVLHGPATMRRGNFRARPAEGGDPEVVTFPTPQHMTQPDALRWNRKMIDWSSPFAVRNPARTRMVDIGRKWPTRTELCVLITKKQFEDGLSAQCTLNLPADLPPPGLPIIA